MNLDEMKAKKAELGYSNEKISELSGVPLGTVQKIFAGITRHPRYDTLMSLEKAFPSNDINPCGGGTSYGYPCGASVIRDEAAAYRPSAGYTLDDYYALPDEKRVELIDGEFYDMSSPSSIHQLLCLELAHLLLEFIRSKNGSCVPFASPIDVQLDCDDRTMVEPDVIVVCDRSKIIKRCIYGSPDLVIEILSPSTRGKDMFIKLSKYRNAGVREYWLVDPDKKQVIVYDFAHDDSISVYGFDAKVPVGIFDGGCVIDFAKLYDYVSFLY